MLCVLATAFSQKWTFLSLFQFDLLEKNMYTERQGGVGGPQLSISILTILLEYAPHLVCNNQMERNHTSIQGIDESKYHDTPEDQCP